MRIARCLRCLRWLRWWASPLLLAGLILSAAFALPRGHALFEWWYRWGFPAWAELPAALAERSEISFSLLSSALLGAADLLLCLRWFRRGVRARRLAREVGRALRLQFGAAGWIFLLVLLPWGLLHRRAPLEERGCWPAPPAEQMRELLRAEVRGILASLSVRERPPIPARAPGAALAELLDQLEPGGHPAPRRVKEFVPAGALSALGLSGIFLPGWMEPHIEPDLLAPERVFAQVHEQAHSAGITSEGEANLLAYLALCSASNPGLRYCALIALVRHEPSLLGEGGLIWPEYLVADLRAIAARARGARIAWLARAARASNDTYLRLAGDRGGLSSYGALGSLLARWRAHSGEVRTAAKAHGGRR